MRERDLADAVFLGEVRGELAEEKVDVVLAVAQGRHAYLDGVEAVIEVLSEPALAHRVHQVDVGGGHDTDVGLLHLGGADLHVFAVLQHAEQHDLRAQREFADLVEEEGAAVGLLEIPLAGLRGSGEGTLLVSEQFGVDSPFGDASAVDCEVLAVAAEAVLMYYAGDVFLAHAALAGDEHGEVGGGYGHGCLEGPVERRVVADYVVTVL